MSPDTGDNPRFDADMGRGFTQARFGASSCHAVWIIVAATLLVCGACSRSTPPPPASSGPQPIDEAATEAKPPRDAAVPSVPQEPRPETTAELVGLGKKLYGDNCSVCHGDNGKGDGKAAYLLLPRPRDFSEGKFNRKNTPPQNLPGDEDLFQTVSDGLLGSSMPPWKDYLTEKERWATVDYLKKELIAITYEGEVVSRYELEPPKPPLSVPAEIPATPENVAIGEAIYQSVAECWTCHGRGGQGDGPQSQEIVNTRGERIYPIDLTKGAYKLSSNNEEIFRRIRDGIPLAAMYSMSEKLTDEEVWCLVHYVRSLTNRTGEQRERDQQYRRTIEASKVVGDLPTEPDDEAWKEISANYIPLMPLWWRRERIEGVFVKAMHNGHEISIQLSWADDSEDRSVMSYEDFHDGAAVQFAAADNPPLFAMGAKGAPVKIWHWKADWEVEQSIDQKYPNMATDHYQYRIDNVVAAYDQEKALITKHNPLFLTGWGSDNPFSNPERKTAVEDVIAGGIGTLTSQGPDAQEVRGAGTWYKGLWRVAFNRPLSTKDEGDVRLSAGDSVNVGFAVWNGSQMDRNGQKSVTIWHNLKLAQ